MLFSTEFQLERTVVDDWFDPILNADTRLFVDPFLIFKEQGDSEWAGSHGVLIEHFCECFRLLAEGNCNPNTIPYRKAVALLTFPEPKEFCLGYTSIGTSGAGGGRGYARAIARAMCNAISRGKTHLRHFEELGIFNEGIGADRISDITCNILKTQFIDYTQSAATLRDIPMEEHHIQCASLNEIRLRWEADRRRVPTNPVNGYPLLLVPKRFVRDLPQIEKTDWWSWHENELIREDFNYEILGNVDKKFIVDMANRHPESVEAYIRVAENQEPDPYDLSKDPLGAWQWASKAQEFISRNPVNLAPPRSDDEFAAAIEQVVESFRRFIEQMGGWRLLWNDDGNEKPESAAQLLLRGIAENHCRSNGVVIDREVELGRGPVDFAFSNGYSNRALLEVKKLHNGKYWDGLENQLLSYLESDNCPNGYFLSIQYRDGGVSERRQRELPRRVSALRERYGAMAFRYQTVDARPKPSASRL